MTGSDRSRADLGAIADTLPGLNLTLITSASAHVHHLPSQWQPIAAETDPQIRLAAALALWNPPLLEALPQFATALRTRFIDVRACFADGEPALLYLAEHGDGHLVSWIGFTPANFVEPQFWDHFPKPLQMFLRHVHAGFASDGPVAFGSMPPRYMETLAELADEPEGIADWDEVQEIASTRLLLVTTNGGMIDYCVSPDLEVGLLAIVFQGDIDPTPFGAALDELLMGRLRS